MKRADTRGLSTVITTVIIILLVIVAIGIVWGVLRNMISKNAELITLGKFTIDLEIVSVTQNSYGTNIKVKRNPGEGDLEGIVFSIFDGEETFVFEKKGIELDQLEVKTFTVTYYGDIVSISVYPMFSTESGKSTMGDISDTYYDSGSGIGDGSGYIDPNCIPECTGICGDDGCGGECQPGCSGGTPYCVSGTCQAGTGGLEPDCSCALTTCIGTTCDDGLGGTCWGLEQPDCINEFGYVIDCGPSENGCGICAECDTGYHCYEGTCQPDCIGNCTGKECGDNGCGVSCGECSLIGPNWVCNALFKCEECQPSCLAIGRECGNNGCGGSCGDCELLYGEGYNCNATGMCELCTPDCISEDRECGPVPNGCGESCGNCSELYSGFPEDSCTTEGVCYIETVKNTGTVYSFWPSPEGRMLFDSEDLPISPLIDYTGYYVKFPGSAEDGICMRIYDFVTPINPLVYDKTYMKISEDPTLINVGDDYEVWETYSACCKNYC
jgi:hypothetical protein